MKTPLTVFTMQVLLFLFDNNVLSPAYCIVFSLRYITMHTAAHAWTLRT